MGPYQLVFYTGGEEDYVVIVSPILDPEDFCLPEYSVTQRMDIGDAGDFPADVCLCMDCGFPEPDIEPDEGPLVEHYKTVSQLGDDGWLEADFEDRISGWEE
jgi:hypothetical protein